MKIKLKITLQVNAVTRIIFKYFIFSRIINIKERRPVDFDSIIFYSGSSIDPMRIFISKKMTKVLDAVDKGDGKLLANVREIPESASSKAEMILQSAMDAEIGGVANIGKPVLDAPVDNGKIGIAVYAGVNGVAAVDEKGINVSTYPISTTMEFSKMKKL